jgi:hypothetical protein
MQHTPNKLRLIWADKIVLWLAILMAAMAAFAWVLIGVAAGPMGANHVLASVGTGGTLEIAALLLTLWAILRALDFAAGGATYKLFHALPARDESVLPTSGNLLAR